jgi:hypothetical protein
MKAIPLTKGFATIVDNEDYDRLIKYRWHVLLGNKGIIYATGRTGSQKKVLMHRFIMNAKPRQILDHINFDGLDNRKSNLRFCDKSQNAHHNRRGYTGVKQHNSGKGNSGWNARIRIGNGDRINLGTFQTRQEAEAAYHKAAIEHYGEFHG